jgi:hypothetical protein
MTLLQAIHEFPLLDAPVADLNKSPRETPVEAAEVVAAPRRFRSQMRPDHNSAGALVLS